MKKLNRGKEKGLTKDRKSNKRSRSKVIAYLYVAYITIILITKVIPILADTYIDSVQNDMASEYTYHLRFPIDGYQSHYYVERWNTSAYGIIDLTYYTDDNRLEVSTANIRVLGIDSRSMYLDECEKISGRNPYDDSNMYKRYFIERDHFVVNIITVDGRPIENLSFKDIPIAYEVRVNGGTLAEGTDYWYASNYGLVIGDVPAGFTNVDIWFKSSDNTGPTAMVNYNDVVAEVNEEITFDASSSHDDMGIESYYWDFGEGNFSVETQSSTTFSYPREGNYTVILTVRDEDGLVDREYINVIVIPAVGNHAPTINSMVPNQEKFEDSAPWSLNLSNYGDDTEDLQSELKWFVTGDNQSLYLMIGENMSNALTFVPLPNAYGSDKVTIWLIDSQGAMDSQELWINITPVNDKPYFDPPPPNVIVHYFDPDISTDDPFTWDYTAYVHDVETSPDDLILTTSEPTTDNGNGYIVMDGMEATFYYPYSMLGSTIPVTLTVSDGEGDISTVITVKVTSNWAPRLLESLPDITMDENVSIYNAFDLDDYFWDRDMDTLFYASGHSHIEIVINANNSVDFISLDNWTGTEYVTFRAEDPTAAIIEDTVVITIRPVNDPPVIRGVPDISIHYDYTYAFDVAPYIEDYDDSIDTLTLRTSESENNIWVGSQSNTLLMFNYPEDRDGDIITVTIWVSDGKSESFQDITVIVSDNYPPELTWNLPDISFMEDEYFNSSFDLDFYFIDVDGNILYYTYGYTFIEVNIKPDQTVDFLAPVNWFGTELITFRATDPTGAMVEDTITVTVIPVNDAPTIEDIPDQNAREGDSWVLDISEYISDIDNLQSELHLVIQSEAGGQYVISSGFFLIFNYPEGIREDTVTVTVSDGDLNSSESFSVTIESIRPAKTFWDEYLGPVILLIMIASILLGLIGYRVLIGKYEVHEVFLIHQTGLFIAHVTSLSTGKVTNVRQSGMLMAGMQLIRNSFSEDTEEFTSKKMRVMGKNLVAEKGEIVYILVVYTGYARKNALDEMKASVENIEDRYGEFLHEWDGDMEDMVGIEEYLDTLL
jgi:hypothetical protein